MRVKYSKVVNGITMIKLDQEVIVRPYESSVYRNSRRFYLGKYATKQEREKARLWARSIDYEDLVKLDEERPKNIDASGYWQEFIKLKREHNAP